MTFRPINLPFCSEEKSYWCRFEKKEKSHHGASTLVWEKSHNGALNCTKMTFLQNTNEPHLLKSTPLWLFSRPEMKHLCDFSLFSQICTNMTFPQNKVEAPLWLFYFLGPKLQKQFLGWKNAQIPQLIDSDGRALHKDSESGPNSKITKITNMTFLQNTAEISIPQLVGKSFTCCQGAADTLSWTWTRISLCWLAVRKAWSLAGLGLHRTFLVAQTPSTGDTFCLSPRCSHKQTLCEA